MSAAREAIILPLLFLSVTLLAGLQLGRPDLIAAPSEFALVLACLLIGVLVRSGALAPDRLLRASRRPLENANGAVVLVTLFAASAQLLTLLTPSSGLPLLLFDAFLLVLLTNTLIVAPDRARALRSLVVILGSAFVLKFVVLASLSDPDGGRMHRVLIALFDAATLGTMSQDRLAPASGYVAFAAIGLYVIGAAALPASGRWLTRASRESRTSDLAELPDTGVAGPREEPDA
jgi:hypothetical protein